MSMNVVTLLYLVASVCFIQALKGLSHPTTSIRGNVFGMTGMAIAVLTTAALIVELAGSVGGLGWVLLGLLIGGTAGTIMAKRVEMTKMPELVAFMHSMIGMAAVFIAIAAVVEPYAFGITAKGQDIPAGNRLELFLGAAIGASVAADRARCSSLTPSPDANTATRMCSPSHVVAANRSHEALAEPSANAPHRAKGRRETLRFASWLFFKSFLESVNCFTV